MESIVYCVLRSGVSRGSSTTGVGVVNAFLGRIVNDESWWNECLVYEQMDGMRVLWVCKDMNMICGMMQWVRGDARNT